MKVLGSSAPHILGGGGLTLKTFKKEIKKGENKEKEKGKTRKTQGRFQGGG